MKRKSIKNKEVKPSVIKDINEDTNEVKKLIFILLGVVLIALLLYFITAKYLVKDNFQSEEEATAEITITYDTVKAGNLFNRPYDEYYVFAYDSSSTSANYYSTLLNKYNGDTKIYYLDLSVEVNKQYVGETGNSKASNVSELSIVDPTLILIKNGSINEYYEGKTSIVNILG